MTGKGRAPRRGKRCGTMKSKLSLVLVIALSVGLVISLYGVGGAANSRSVAVSANVNKTASLVMPATVDFGAVDPEGTGGGSIYVGNDYAGVAIDGAEYAVPVLARVKSNAAWNLEVYADQDLTAGASTIPNGQLGLTGGDITDETFGIGAAAAKNVFGASQAKSAKGNPFIDVNLDYELLISWADDPGNYSATHTYTVIQP